MTDSKRGFQRRIEKPKQKRTRRVERSKVGIRCETGGRLGGGAGEVRDIAEDGIRILSGHGYRVGERIAVTLLVPGFAKLFDLIAEVKWVEPAGGTDRYELGCTFLHTKQTRKLIQALRDEFTAGNMPEIRRRKGDKTTRFGQSL